MVINVMKKIKENGDIIGGNLLEEATSELRPEWQEENSHSKTWEKSTEAIGNSKCKHPKAGASLSSSRDKAIQDETQKTLTWPGSTLLI